MTRRAGGRRPSRDPGGHPRRSRAPVPAAGGTAATMMYAIAGELVVALKMVDVAFETKSGLVRGSGTTACVRAATRTPAAQQEVEPRGARGARRRARLRAGRRGTRAWSSPRIGGLLEAIRSAARNSGPGDRRRHGDDIERDFLANQRAHRRTASTTSAALRPGLTSTPRPTSSGRPTSPRWHSLVAKCGWTLEDRANWLGGRRLLGVSRRRNGSPNQLRRRRYGRVGAPRRRRHTGESWCAQGIPDCHSAGLRPSACPCREISVRSEERVLRPGFAGARQPSRDAGSGSGSCPQRQRLDVPHRGSSLAAATPSGVGNPANWETGTVGPR